MLDWSTCPAVERVPGKVSGEWLFKGTRVPVKALFENLEGGARVSEFLEWFPDVTREQVEQVLLHAEKSPRLHILRTARAGKQRAFACQPGRHALHMGQSAIHLPRLAPAPLLIESYKTTRKAPMSTGEFLKRVLIVAILIVGGLVFWLARDIMVSVFAAIMIAVAVTVPARWFEGKGMKRG